MSITTPQENLFEGRMAERFALVIDKDWTERETRLHIYKKIYEGKLYDNLTPWNIEYQGGANGGGTYIPLAQRRPSVIYNIPKIIVDESTSMLFGESHFPVLRGEEQEHTDFFDQLVKKTHLRSKMLSAAKKGALGSVCVLIKVLKGKLFVDVLGTQHLTPIFDWEDPCKLIGLQEKRKVSGATLIARGYEGIKEDDKGQMYYVVREWGEQEEIYYDPYKCEKDQDKKFKPSQDMERSTEHNFGFVPAIWIKNNEDDEHIDGQCTFSSVIDNGIEIDYQLSQLGRLLRYNSDPTLVIKDPSQLSDQQIIKGMGPITLGEHGDAWLLEMTSGSTTAVIEYVRALREMALEVVRGNRANPDKLSAIHSGKALQMLNAKLITLVEDLRLAYGENGLKRVICMMIEIIKGGEFELAVGTSMPEFGDDPMEDITLEWPEWYPPTPQDDVQESQALQTYVTTGILSKEGALKVIADKYHVLDIKKELTASQNDARLTAEAQSKAVEGASKKPKPAVARQKSKSVDRSDN